MKTKRIEKSFLETLVAIAMGLGFIMFELFLIGILSYYFPTTHYLPFIIGIELYISLMFYLWLKAEFDCKSKKIIYMAIELIAMICIAFCFAFATPNVQTIVICILAIISMFFYSYYF